MYQMAKATMVTHTTIPAANHHEFTCAEIRNERNSSVRCPFLAVARGLLIAEHYRADAEVGDTMGFTALLLICASP